MNKKTKLAILISAVAAVVSAVVLLIVFWDKLAAMCPCKKQEAEMEDFEETEEVEEEAPVEETAAYSEEELADFADLEPAEEE